jgi:heme-degrading monooxygenase HmoA
MVTRKMALSYWEAGDQIKLWKSDPARSQDQEKGKAKWYSSDQDQVVKVIESMQKPHVRVAAGAER